MAMYHLQVQYLIRISDWQNIDVDFRAVFPSKSETEEHVGVSHVLGNLS